MKKPITDARSIAKIIQQFVSGMIITDIMIDNNTSNQTIYKFLEKHWFYRKFGFEEITETITIKSKSHEHRKPYVSYRQIARMRRLRRAIRKI